MANATESTGMIAAPTIRTREAAHFGALAAQWWDPKGSSAMLHRLNPVRLGYIRQAVDAHFGGDPAARKPLSGKRALDVGCGGGLLCEPLRRLGAEMTGLDASIEVVAAARAHAAAMELDIDYRAGEIGALETEPFDLVTALEVIEHVDNKPAFVAALADRLAPGGLMILSTPNRTSASRLLLVDGAEAVGAIPRGTHDWDDFVTPDELRALLGAVGLTMGSPRGIAWSPLRGFELSDRDALNYIVTATRD